MLRDPKVLICFVFIVAGSLIIDWFVYKWIFWDLPVWFFGAVNMLAFYKLVGMGLITFFISLTLAANIKRRSRTEIKFFMI